MHLGAVCVDLDRFWMWGSAGKYHLGAQRSCPGQRKSLVWGHSYTPHLQAAPGWAGDLSSPSLPDHRPGDKERGSVKKGWRVWHRHSRHLLRHSPGCFCRRVRWEGPCPLKCQSGRQWERGQLGSLASSVWLCCSEQSQGPRLCTLPRPASACLSRSCAQTHKHFLMQKPMGVQEKSLPLKRKQSNMHNTALSRMNWEKQIYFIAHNIIVVCLQTGWWHDCIASRVTPEEKGQYVIFPKFEVIPFQFIMRVIKQVCKTTTELLKELS